MVFLKNKSKRYNLLFIKSFEVVGSTCDLFKIKIIGNDDRINYLEVNILEVIKINELDKFIDPKDLNQIIREVYQKTLKDLNQYGNIKNIMYTIDLYDEDPIIEIDIEEIIYKNSTNIIDTYLYKREGGEVNGLN